MERYGYDVKIGLKTFRPLAYRFAMFRKTTISNALRKEFMFCSDISWSVLDGDDLRKPFK